MILEKYPRLMYNLSSRDFGETKFWKKLSDGSSQLGKECEFDNLSHLRANEDTRNILSVVKRQLFLRNLTLWRLPCTSESMRIRYALPFR